MFAWRRENIWQGELCAAMAKKKVIGQPAAWPLLYGLLATSTTMQRLKAASLG